MRRYGIVMLGACLGTACSSATLKKAPFLTASTFVEESVNESEDAKPIVEEKLPEPIPMTEEIKAPEEKVNPPSNISGSYLICAETKAATEDLPESTISCGLRDQKNNNRINIGSAFASKAWTYEAADSESLSVSMVELQSIEWNIAVTLRADTLAELEAVKPSMRFYITVTNSAGLKFQESAPITSSFVQWLSLNGAQIPRNAAIGGTEDDERDTLYLCRIYVDGEVIPGKLEVHSHTSSKSNCFTPYNGSTISSQSDDASTMNYRSDVLAITQDVFDDYFEWVPSTNGLKPVQALITGRDAVGNPLYTCRNLQSDGNFAEQTPGVLRPGASSCTHSFNGVKSNTNYQVLAWKESGTQKIMTIQKAAAP